MLFQFGIEHGASFVDSKGAFADFSNTRLHGFQQIVHQLPRFESDYSDLPAGDAGIEDKRGYAEDVGEVSQPEPGCALVRDRQHWLLSGMKA